MDLQSFIENYRKATEQFIKVAGNLSEAQLDKRKDQGWSARQVIHHVADSEAQSYARLRRLIAEPGTQIQGYDEGAWGEDKTLGYSVLPIEISLDVFKAVRASSLEVLKRIFSLLSLIELELQLQPPMRCKQLMDLTRNYKKKDS